jgi:ketosteroid isomerase-like protein
VSQQNVEIVRKVYEAVARRDATGVLALYDPDVMWDGTRTPFGALTGAALYHGHDGLRTFFRHWYEAWENLEEPCEELIDAGEQVISVSRFRAQGRTSGLEVELPDQVGVWTIREGKIVRVVWFPTRAEALEAVGLSR